VVGDLAGFAAASYMRGIDFYNCPTTLLSQIDSSIGGKVAVDFQGYKNIVGAFHQPRCVLIDPDVLSTLPPRRIADGLAEAIKMAATSDAELFELLETKSAMDHVETVIARSLRVKRDVVEQDEKETGLRRVLNFGHTLGHAIESCEEGRLYHGECVALGMLGMCAPEARKRIRAVLARVGLPTAYDGDRERILCAMRHDKKAAGEGVNAVYVPRIGEFVLEHIPYETLIGRLADIGAATV
jgi:3-dehydroquinate synthetase